MISETFIKNLRADYADTMYALRYRPAMMKDAGTRSMRKYFGTLAKRSGKIIQIFLGTEFAVSGLLGTAFLADAVYEGFTGNYGDLTKDVVVVCASLGTIRSGFWLIGNVGRKLRQAASRPDSRYDNSASPPSAEPPS